MEDKKKNLEQMLYDLLTNKEMTPKEISNFVQKVLEDYEADPINIDVGWFAFAGGNFSPYPNAYPNCQGVVAWVNSDTNAPEGERGLIVTPDEVESPWTCTECYTGVTNDEDGKQNTRLLLDYGRKHGLNWGTCG